MGGTSLKISNLTSINTEIDNSIRNRIMQDCKSKITQGNTINIVGSSVKNYQAKINSLQNTCICQSILKVKRQQKLLINY
jgi:hypothetical protein